MKPPDPNLTQKAVPDAPPDLPAGEEWDLLQRVVQNDSFRRAPRLRELLLHITEKALRGRTAELNEHEIAVAVFRRTATFNPADDSIVRSSARQLRTKLHEYFEGPGRDEGVVIEIPKGSYVPEFVHRAAAPAIVPGGTLPWKALAIGFGAAVLVLAVLLVRSAMSPKREESQAKAANLVTWLFGNRGQQVNVVACDSALVVVNSYRPHMLTLDDYIHLRDQEPLPLPGGKPADATPPEFPGMRLITSFRDMAMVSRLGEIGAASGIRIELKHSRLMQVRDFRTGSHILLGSAWSNPWTTLFEDQLTFRFKEEPETGSFGLANTQPGSGEQRFYWCPPSQSRNGVSYARIAIVPNLSGQQTILLISGLHTESSEGALDSALSPDFLRQLRRLTGANKPEDLNGLELLLEVTAVDGVVRNTRLIARRDHRKV